MKDKLKTIVSAALEQVQDSNKLDELNNIRVKFLGKKGELTSILKSMKDVPKEEIGRASCRERV